MIYFFIFAISFIIVFLITPNIRYLALKFYVIDKRNYRKIHQKLVTKLGGLAIYIGFLGGLFPLFFLDIGFLKAHLYHITGLIFCAALALLLGIYDDFQGSGALIKLIVQTLIALLLVRIGFRLERFYIPNLIDIHLGSLSIPLTVLWLVGITNAINLIDGLDGLAAGIITIATFFLCLYGLIIREGFVVYVSLALMGANLAFLKYNYHPAKIFMGDTGSLFLGFIVGSLALYDANLNGKANLIFVPSFILLLLPIMDTTLAIIRRFVRRQNIFKGDFSHIHHYYIKRGLGQPQVVKRFYIITFCLGTFSLFFLFLNQFSN